MSARARTERVGVGIDGCRNGWVVAVVAASAKRPSPPRLRVISRIEALAGVLAELDVAPACCLVDIPIGLVGSGRRELDVLAAAALGGRSSSVFAVPPRVVFDALDFQEAGRLARDAMGQGLTLQAWNIMGKIREVDLHLRRRMPLPPDLRESHPELVFARLAALTTVAGRGHAAGNSGTPGAAAAPLSPKAAAPLPSKKSPAGLAARVAILAAHGVDAHAALAAPPAPPDGKVARDDILDAIALAVVAARPVSMQDVLRGRHWVDPLGLPMEMVLPSMTPAEGS